MRDIVDHWQVRTAAAVLAAFPLASLEATASTASASGSSVALSPALPQYGYSSSFSQPTTGSAFMISTNMGIPFPIGLPHSSSASFDGVHGFGVAVAMDKIFLQDSARSQASLTYTTSISNTTGSAQPATYSFTIASINFSLSNVSVERAGETALASFAARIYAGASATPIWSTGFSLTQANSSHAFDIASETGSSIGMLASYSAAIRQLPSPFAPISFGISGYSTVLNLGDLNPGATLNLRYEVDVDAESNAYGGDAQVSFADPVADLAFSGAVAAVPEPSESALLIGGIALLGAVVRRRRHPADATGQRN